MGLIIEDVGVRRGDEATPGTFLGEIKEFLRIELGRMTEALRDVDVQHVRVSGKIIFEKTSADGQRRVEEKEKTPMRTRRITQGVYKQ